MKEMISQYQPLWFSIAQKYTKNYHQSEELVQDALSRYLQGDNGEVKNVKAYVAKTIYHLYINQIRKGKINQAYTKEVAATSSEAMESTSQVEVQSEVKQQLLRMHSLLTPSERAVFILRKAFDTDFDSMDEYFGISNENARQLMCRAKNKLQNTGKAGKKENGDAEAFVQAFFRASQHGRFEELVDLLKKDIQKKYLRVSKAGQYSTAKVIGMENNGIKTSKRA